MQHFQGHLLKIQVHTCLPAWKPWVSSHMVCYLFLTFGVEAQGACYDLTHSTLHRKRLVRNVKVGLSMSLGPSCFHWLASILTQKTVGEGSTGPSPPLCVSELDYLGVPGQLT